MSAKHTPGPWTVGERCGQEIEVNAPNGDPTLGYDKWRPMAIAYGSDAEPHLGADVMEANARLMAAAPDLLDIVRYVYDALGTGAPLYNTHALHMRLSELLGRIDGEQS